MTNLPQQRQKLSPIEILFKPDGQAISPAAIHDLICEFGESYSKAVKKIIVNSEVLGQDGKVFIECASIILSNFGMKRRGPFQNNIDKTLLSCWNAVGASLIEINHSVRKSNLPRDRFLLEINERERERLIEEIWTITKKLLPFTMGGTSYGLVGASKILFSVLPEIVLPIDNTEWLHVFKTVDIGDVLHRMVFDIQEWEGMTGRQLNDLDPLKRLTTLPSVYNVMAMDARYKSLDN